MAKKLKKKLTRKSSLSAIPVGYSEFIKSLKEKVRTSQIKAALSVNRELIRLYWEIGKDISDRQGQERWGTSVIEKVARDLQSKQLLPKGRSFIVSLLALAKRGCYLRADYGARCAT